MNFFEYLFCRIYWWNTQIIKEKDIPIVYSITGLSVFQGFSIIPFYNVIYICIYKSFYIKDILNISPYLLIGIIVLTIDYLYFKKPRYIILLKKFNKIPKAQKKKKDILCIIYIAILIIVNVWFTIYIRSYNVSP
jgi:hypothetical protein